MNELEKTKSKLKMMEISFEQINNSRNDLIKQLAEQEAITEQITNSVEMRLDMAKTLKDDYMIQLMTDILKGR